MAVALQVVKLGGSLLTDKSTRERLRPGVLKRLVSEIRSARERGADPLMLAHGSGSFGHFAAAGTPLAAVGGALEAAAGERALALTSAIARTQDAAARLHRVVCGALLEAGLTPFSIAPSALFVEDSGAEHAARVLAASVRAELLPVVYGDVVLSAEGGAAIWSTERVLVELASALGERGLIMAVVHWLGTTAGILDDAGETLPMVSTTTLSMARAAAGSSAGVDVTGGMRLRLDTAWKLAQRGVRSWIYDGRVPGALEEALMGRQPLGTEVRSDGVRS